MVVERSQVQDFLTSLFIVQDAGVDQAPAAASQGESLLPRVDRVLQQRRFFLETSKPCAPQPTKTGHAKLTLHPKVDAIFPGGMHVHSAEELQAVLTTYRALLSGVTLEIQDVVVSGDRVRPFYACMRGWMDGWVGGLKLRHAPSHAHGTTLTPFVNTQPPKKHHTLKALVACEQLIHSRLEGATHLLSRYVPAPLTELAAHTLPAITLGRVLTAVALSIGKSDAGDPVVTKLQVVFNLPAALCPHLHLPHWQQQLVKRGGDAALCAAKGAGWAAGVAEDAWVAAAAAYRAGGALGQPASEAVWEALQRAVAAAFEAAKARVMGGEGAGVEQAGAAKREREAGGQAQIVGLVDD